MRKWIGRHAKALLFGIGAAAAAVAVVAAATAPRSSAQGTQRTSVAMGAVVNQTVYGDPAAAGQAAADANAAVAALEQRISWRIDSSETARINQAAGSGAVECSGTTLALLRQCLDVAEKSGGAFDPCILPVSRLWDFDAEQFSPPQNSEIRSGLAVCSWKLLSLTDSQVSLELSGAGLDLGGIGKGAACNEALRVYAESGVSAAVVAVGGSVGVFGTKPDSSAWSIGVRDPEGGSADSLGTLALTSGCVSTSGTYEKKRESGGVTYHHILDPRTGYPAESDLVSATVICDSGALSDALATACVVLGREKAETLLAEYPAEYLLIDKSRVVYAGGGAEKRFTLSSADYTLRKP